jgi:hypothetical protein
MRRLKALNSGAFSLWFTGLPDEPSERIGLVGTDLAVVQNTPEDKPFPLHHW